MNDLQEKAMRMALKYFEDAYGLEDTEVAIKEALREALAEPDHIRGVTKKVEPVAWLEEVFNDDNKSLGYLAHEQSFENTTPVYTTPKKEWIGLTDEQIYEHEWWDEETAFAVNKELMEKNHG